MASFLLKFVLFISFLVLFCDCGDTKNEGETEKLKAEKGDGNEGPKNEGETGKKKAKNGGAENTKEGDQISDAKKDVLKKDLIEDERSERFRETTHR
ncbi:hypothetical protein niasHS_000116 [Heterodera schachtii]|uniref:Uncharacterized protein n=1 Tax=Heterodera schachtii TaxID=97005 RepID=A0ABD2K6Q4_HETSC